MEAILQQHLFQLSQHTKYGAVWTTVWFFRKFKCDGTPSAMTKFGYGRYRHNYIKCVGREFRKLDRNANDQEDSRFGWRIKVKRVVGDIRKRRDKMSLPKDYRIKRSCCRKIAVRENLRNLEKLVRMNCAAWWCCFVQTHVQSLDILDEMENCSAGGWDFDTDWLTEGRVNGSFRRTVPVIVFVSKEDCRSKLRHKPVKLAVAINFVIWASERSYFKFNALTWVAIFNSYFSFV